MDKYNIPYLECPNLIKDNQGNFGLKNIRI